MVVLRGVEQFRNQGASDGVLLSNGWDEGVSEFRVRRRRSLTFGLGNETTKMTGS